MLQKLYAQIWDESVGGNFMNFCYQSEFRALFRHSTNWTDCDDSLREPNDFCYRPFI